MWKPPAEIAVRSRQRARAKRAHYYRQNPAVAHAWLNVRAACDDAARDVLAALADPVRLEMVRRLAAADGPAVCATLYDGIGKSTASHHFKILREAGVID